MKLMLAAFAITLSGCATDAKLVDENSRLPRVEIYDDARGKCRWRVKSNGKIIATASQGYESEESCRRSIEITKIAIERLEASATRP